MDDLDEMDYKELIRIQTVHVDLLQRALNIALDGLKYYLDQADNEAAKDCIERIHVILKELERCH